MLIKYSLLLLLMPCVLAINVLAQDSDKGILNTFHSISSNDMLKDAAELTSAKYGGRLSGSPGYMQAAQWVAGELKKAGVKSGVADGSYLQYFPNAYSVVHTPGNVTMLAGKGNARKEYHFPDDFFPGSNSASGKITGDLVYVGYGISAPELGYDDYRNIDVKGKILLMETGVPYGKNDSTQLKWEPYSYHRYKFKHAQELGAIGLLYVSKIANPNTSFLKGFVYAHVGDSVAVDFFAGTGHKYIETRNNIAKLVKPNSFALNKKVQISASTSYFPDSRSCNVVGIIEDTSGTVKTVYYHHPLDTTDALTPEIMEDAAKLLYLGVLDLANEK